MDYNIITIADSDKNVGWAMTTDHLQSKQKDFKLFFWRTNCSQSVATVIDIGLGFLDGVQGLIFHFLQGFWYLFLVDAKIYEIKRNQK